MQNAVAEIDFIPVVHVDVLLDRINRLTSSDGRDGTFCIMGKAPREIKTRSEVLCLASPDCDGIVLRVFKNNSCVPIVTIDRFHG